MRRSRPKRASRPPPRYQCASMPEGKEEASFRAAVQNSKAVLQRDADIHVPPMRVFRPTEKEFENPIRYINSIKSEASRFGVVKVIPPASWKPPKQLFPSYTQAKFDTKRQAVNKLQQGRPYGDGKLYTPLEYYQEAQNLIRTRFPQFSPNNVVPGDEQAEKWRRVPYKLSSTLAGTPMPACDTPFESGDKFITAVEREYWRVVETQPYELQVDYGADIHSHKVVSGFTHNRPEPGEPEEHFLRTKLESCIAAAKNDLTREHAAQSPWNLHNLPFAKGSMLRHIPELVSGVNLPWVYLGMAFTSFAWHTEDNHLCSISYNHFGCPKVWYGCPSTSAAAFEKTIKSQVHTRFKEDPNLLQELVTVLSPNVLKASGVEVFRGVQNPGEFMITFPKAYHSGLNTGFNCAEAVNFAFSGWIPFGRRCLEQYRRIARSSAVSHDELIISAARHGEERSVEECTLLVDELTLLLHEERTTRRKLREDGIGSNVHLSNKGHFPRKDCCVCEHTCFLSAVVCKCSNQQVACLRHHSDMCDCPIGDKCLVSYVRTSKLANLVERVTNRRNKVIYSLKARGQSVKRERPSASSHSPKAAKKARRSKSKSKSKVKAEPPRTPADEVETVSDKWHPVLVDGHLIYEASDDEAEGMCQLCGAQCDGSTTEGTMAFRGCAKCAKLVASGVRVAEVELKSSHPGAGSP